jgi:hypothetical protein
MTTIKKDIDQALFIEFNINHGIKYKFEDLSIKTDPLNKIKLTCFNEILAQELSVITNDDNINISPFGKLGHLAKIIARTKNGKKIELIGHFTETEHSSDDFKYVSGIITTLISGSPIENFGRYDYKIVSAA